MRTTTRPDLRHAASTLARDNNCRMKAHWKGPRGTLKYLKGTNQLTLKYQATNEDPKLKLEVKIYSDADYARDKDNRRSRTGYAVMTTGGLIVGQSELQTTIATSTTEAEYQAAATAIKEGLWIRNFIKHLLNTKEVSVTINIDNQSTLRLLKNPQSITKAKHIDVQHHFIRERAARKEVKLTNCPTEEMLANFLTKQVPSSKFNKSIKGLGMNNSCTRLSGSVGKKAPKLGFHPSPGVKMTSGDPPKADGPRTRDRSSDDAYNIDALAETP